MILTQKEVCVFNAQPNGIPTLSDESVAQWCKSCEVE